MVICKYSKFPIYFLIFGDISNKLYILPNPPWITFKVIDNHRNIHLNVLQRLLHVNEPASAYSVVLVLEGTALWGFSYPFNKPQILSRTLRCLLLCPKQLGWYVFHWVHVACTHITQFQAKTNTKTLSQGPRYWQPVISQ